MYYYIEPEVSGGLGEKSIIDSSTHPPKVEKLHYRFEGWLGDDLLESFPCYVVSDTLKRKILNENLGGIEFRDVYTSKSDQFNELYPDKNLPDFHWLYVTGEAGISDFGIANDFRLVISNEALKILKQGQIDNADIEEYT